MFSRRPAKQTQPVVSLPAVSKVEPSKCRTYLRGQALRLGLRLCSGQALRLAPSTLLRTSPLAQGKPAAERSFRT